jgi:hypothetical protein
MAKGVIFPAAACSFGRLRVHAKGAATEVTTPLHV